MSRAGRAALQVAQLVVQDGHRDVLVAVGVLQLVLPLAQQRELHLDLIALRVKHRVGLAALAASLAEAAQRHAQVLVLGAQRVAHLLVLLERQLALLVEGLAVALEQVEAVLEVGELGMRVHARWAERERLDAPPDRPRRTERASAPG